jgi:hypothetical protein
LRRFYADGWGNNFQEREGNVLVTIVRHLGMRPWRIGKSKTSPWPDKDIAGISDYQCKSVTWVNGTLLRCFSVPIGACRNQDMWVVSGQVRSPLNALYHYDPPVVTRINPTWRYQGLTLALLVFMCAISSSLGGAYLFMVAASSKL